MANATRGAEKGFPTPYSSGGALNSSRLNTTVSPTAASTTVRSDHSYRTDGAETLSVLWLWSLRTVVLAAVGLTVGLSLLKLSAPPLL